MVCRHLIELFRAPAPGRTGSIYAFASSTSLYIPRPLDGRFKVHKVSLLRLTRPTEGVLAIRQSCYPRSVTLDAIGMPT
jgi:hypothetical protein